ncbi:MAG: glutamate racemase [Bdellovibrionales bacterium]
MSEEKYIGVFDSGVGGLSVLTKLLVDFPNESFVYLGDTARLPYGAKSKETIKKYVERNINFLTSNYPIKAVVVACNSASSVLHDLDLPVKTIGVIEAGADAALSKTKTNHIGLWATRATVSSNEYEKELLNLDDEAKLTSISCPTLVTLVEEAGADHPLLEAAFDHYIDKIKDDSEIDTLILGCTHFPFFKERLATYLKTKGLHMELADASEEISIQLKDMLSGSLSLKKNLEDKVLVTDEAPHFKDFISSVLPKKYSFSFLKVDL